MTHQPIRAESDNTRVGTTGVTAQLMRGWKVAGFGLACHIGVACAIQRDAGATRVAASPKDGGIFDAVSGCVQAVVIMEIDLVIIAVVDELSGPAVETTTGAPWWGAVAGVLAFFLGFGIIASAAGMIGGLLGAGLAYAVHRWRGRGGPTAPAGVS